MGKLVAATAAIALVVAALVALGGDDDSPGVALAAAADNSSFEFAFDVTVKGEPGSQRVRMRNIGDDF